MKNDFLADCAGVALFKLLGPCIRILPRDLSFALGRRLGEILFYLGPKRRSLACANIKTALAGRGSVSPAFLNKVTKDFYRSFGQNLIEVFLIPIVDKEYVERYVTFQGLEHVREAFRRGKGVILLGVHEGSWELSNIISACVDVPFNLFVRAQRYPRLNKLLNSYRRQKGCKVIQREAQAKDLIRLLRANEGIGMTIDQGGRNGVLVDFFGRKASFATGAVRLSLKYDAAIIPCFYTRTNGPCIHLSFGAPYQPIRTGDAEADVKENIQQLTSVFEKHISASPHEYLWSYKVWKRDTSRRILILSDARVGHLRQSQAAAQIIEACCKDKGLSAETEIVEVVYKSAFARRALAAAGLTAGKYNCQGCMRCWKAFLTEETYRALISRKPDFVVSCGSSLAPVTYLASRSNLAKSVVCMRPSFMSVRKFDIVIMPRHDHPPRRKNVVVTEGALNLVNEASVKVQARQLIREKAGGLRDTGRYIGLLLGGDTKTFRLEADLVRRLVHELKSVSDLLRADILVTSSRRTSPEVERLLREEFKTSPRCKLLVIANEANTPSAVGGILGLAEIVVVSPDSISMVSEAVSSGKYVVVFDAPSLGRKHRRFLDHFAENGYIQLADAGILGTRIESLWLKRPGVSVPQDNRRVYEAVSRIL